MKRRITLKDELLLIYINEYRGNGRMFDMMQLIGVSLSVLEEKLEKLEQIRLIELINDNYSITSLGIQHLIAQELIEIRISDFYNHFFEKIEEEKKKEQDLRDKIHKIFIPKNFRKKYML